MKKKLLFVHIALWTGGIETALTSMLSQIDYGKYDVTCLILADHQELISRVPEQCKLIISDRDHEVTLKKSYPFRKLYHILEEPIQATPLRRLIWKGVCFAFQNIEESLYSRYIKSNLENTNFDTVVLYSSKACGIGVRVVSAKQYLCFYHYGDLRRVYHDWMGYSRCSRLFAVSENMSEKLCTYLPQYRDKIAPLHNIVDTDLIRSKAAELSKPLAHHSFCIVSCGRLVEDKGFDLVIEACALLMERGFVDFKWYILGGGRLLKELEALIQKKSLSENIQLLGEQSNPYVFIKQADVFVQSSRIEAFGLTITEAQVLGIPVLSTKTDGGKELIVDGETGLLCDISAQSIADGVERLMVDKALYAHIKNKTNEIDFVSRNTEIMRQLYHEIDKS